MAALPRKLQNTEITQRLNDRLAELPIPYVLVDSLHQHVLKLGLFKGEFSSVVQEQQITYGLPSVCARVGSILTVLDADEVRVEPMQ